MSRRLSPVLAADNLLVVYGEASLPDGDATKDRELVQWTAVRVDTGEPFDVASPSAVAKQLPLLRLERLSPGVLFALFISYFGELTEP